MTSVCSRTGHHHTMELGRSGIFEQSHSSTIDGSFRTDDSAKHYWPSSRRTFQRAISFYGSLKKIQFICLIFQPNRQYAEEQLQKQWTNVLAKVLKLFCYLNILLSVIYHFDYRIDLCIASKGGHIDQLQFYMGKNFRNKHIK